MRAPSLNAGEYKRQLSGQQSEINEMLVSDFVKNRALFAKRGRDPADARERRIFRAQARDALLQSIMTGRPVQMVANDDHLLKFVKSVLRNEGKIKNEKKAERIVNAFMSTQAALHEPDQVAGGEVRPKALGDRDVNRDIGQNWAGEFGKPEALADQLHALTTQALNDAGVDESVWNKVKMSVKLT